MSRRRKPLRNRVEISRKGVASETAAAIVTAIAFAAWLLFLPDDGGNGRTFATVRAMGCAIFAVYFCISAASIYFKLRTQSKRRRMKERRTRRNDVE